MYNHNGTKSKNYRSTIYFLLNLISIVMSGHIIKPKNETKTVISKDPTETLQVNWWTTGLKVDHYTSVWMKYSYLCII